MLDKKFTYVEPKTIQRDLEMKETQLETIINMLESSRNKLREKKLEVEQINLQLRMLVLSKNGDGSSRETMEEMKNFTSTEVDKIADKNLQLKSENEELEAEIKEKIETLKNAENDSSRLHKDLKKLLIDYGNKRTTKESLENKLVNHKIDNVEARRKFNLDNENFQNLNKNFELMLNVFNYGNYCKLKEEVMKRQIKGFYGILLDLVDIPEHLRGSLNQLGLSSLFTIVVDTFETAQKVIETNKDLKLGKINLYPLEAADDDGGEDEEHEGLFEHITKTKKRQYPDDDEIAVFEREITPKYQFESINRQLKFIVKDLFKDQIMVETLDIAIQYSKEYFLDCVTLMGEIYRRGGITCDLGYTVLKNDVINRYIELKITEEEYLASKGLIDNFESAQRNFADQLTLFTNECYELELQKDLKVLEYKKSLGEVASIKHAIIQDKKQHYYNLQTIDENKNQIKSLQKSLEVHQGKKQTFTPEKYKQIEEELEELNQEMVEQMSVVTDQEKKYIHLQNQIDGLRSEMRTSKMVECDKDLSNFEKNHLNRKNADKNILKGNLETSIEQLIKKLSKLNSDFKTLSHEKMEIEYKHDKSKKELSEIQKQMSEVNQKRVDFNNIVDRYNIKISSLLVDESEVRKLEKKSDRGLISNLSDVLKSTKHKYTEKDRLNFETLEQNFSEYKQFDEEMVNIKNSKIKLKDMIGHSADHMDEVHNLSVIQFKNKFKEIFEKIVVDGHAQIRITENAAFTQAGTYGMSTQNSNLSSGTYKGLEIVTSFAQLDTNQQNVMSTTQITNESRMENLSPGQKTLVAICIALAFQSISPCPFYFLDEIEADLDTNYVERVSDYIGGMSKDSQIFLTTFKPQMARFQSSNYFMVSIPHNEAVSKIGRIDMKSAADFLTANN